MRSTPSEKGATTQAASARVWASWAANCTIRGRSPEEERKMHIMVIKLGKGNMAACTKLRVKTHSPPDKIDILV